jgi:hypothetical protein
MEVESLVQLPKEEEKLTLIDDILNEQKFTSDEQLWFWGFLGRLFFSNATHDTWKKTLFVLHTSASESSVNLIRKLLLKCFNNEHVGLISHRNTPKDNMWTLQHLHDKYLYVATNVDEATFFESNDMEKMTYGIKLMEIRIKNQRRVEKPWRTPGVWFGTVLPDSLQPCADLFVTFRFLYETKIAEKMVIDDKIVNTFKHVAIESYYKLREVWNKDYEHGLKFGQELPKSLEPDWKRRREVYEMSTVQS